MNTLLKLTAALVLIVAPSLAHAQKITPAATRTYAGAGFSGNLTKGTPGSIAVGGLIEVMVGFYGTSSPTIGLTDAVGNTYSAIVNGTSKSNRAYMFQALVTHASSGSENVTVNFGSSVNYPYMTLVYLAPISGFTYGGVDFSKSGSASSGTLSLSGTASQGNDVLLSVASNTPISIGSSQTTLFDSHNSLGDWSTWSQPSGSDTVSHTYGVTGDTVGVLVAEKVTGGPPPPSYVQCGSSITPSITNKMYIYQCQINGDLMINNPIGLASSGGDSFMLELIQPSPWTAYTVTMDSQYWQPGSPTPNTIKLSTTAGTIDGVPGFSMPALPGGTVHVDLGVTPVLNLGQ